jgi:hypothetical protein
MIIRKSSVPQTGLAAQTDSSQYIGSFPACWMLLPMRSILFSKEPANIIAASVTRK